MQVGIRGITAMDGIRPCIMDGTRPGIIPVGILHGTMDGMIPGIMDGIHHITMDIITIITAADIIIMKERLREEVITVSMHAIQEAATVEVCEPDRPARVRAVIRAQEAKVPVAYQEEILYPHLPVWEDNLLRGENRRR